MNGPSNFDTAGPGWSRLAPTSGMECSFGTRFLTRRKSSFFQIWELAGKFVDLTKKLAGISKVSKKKMISIFLKAQSFQFHFEEVGFC